MNLGELMDLVRASALRGQSLDAQIPEFLFQSVQWLERNYSFAYMEKWLTGTTDPTAKQPELIDLVPQHVKAFLSVKLRLPGPPPYSYRELRRVQQEDRLSPDIVRDPLTYWTEGRGRVWLGQRQTEAQTYEFFVRCFTPWPRQLTDDTREFEHWLVDNATAYLVARTLQYVANFLRDQKAYAFYEEQQRLELRTLILDDEEFGYSDADVRMNDQRDITTHAGARDRW